MKRLSVSHCWPGTTRPAVHWAVERLQMPLTWLAGTVSEPAARGAAVESVASLREFADPLFSPGCR